MRCTRGRRLAFELTLLGACLVAAPSRAASPDPCATTATVSPCFDADPWWIPTGPTAFAGIPSARTLPAGSLSLVLGAGLSIKPVVLVTAAPHPEGQELDVVSATSTVTLGARYGLGRGIDVGVALPFVPFQTGVGTESVTSQQPASLPPVALRDPRVGFAATLLGHSTNAPLALGTRLDIGLPLGNAEAMAGAAGFTVAPGMNGDIRLDRIDVALDLGLRLTRAVSLGTVREGSAATLALGISGTLLDKPRLALGIEGVLRPSLVSAPAGVPDSTHDLPLEWLLSVHFEPDERWSLLLGAGSGLPLSKAQSPTGASESVLAVTSPAFRALVTARCTLPSVL